MLLSNSTMSLNCPIDRGAQTQNFQIHCLIQITIQLRNVEYRTAGLHAMLLPNSILSENRQNISRLTKIKIFKSNVPHYCTVAKRGIYHPAIRNLFKNLLTNACVESCVFIGLQ